MPFKSKKQETYLRINEPEIHKRWVKNYGHYAAEDRRGKLCDICLKGEYFCNCWMCDHCETSNAIHNDLCSICGTSQSKSVSIEAWPMYVKWESAGGVYELIENGAYGSIFPEWPILYLHLYDAQKNAYKPNDNDFATAEKAWELYHNLYTPEGIPILNPSEQSAEETAWYSIGWTRRAFDPADEYDNYIHQEEMAEEAYEEYLEELEEDDEPLSFDDWLTTITDHEDSPEYDAYMEEQWKQMQEDGEEIARLMDNPEYTTLEGTLDAETFESPVSCKICGKTFDSFRGLNGHMNAHLPSHRKRAEFGITRNMQQRSAFEYEIENEDIKTDSKLNEEALQQFQRFPTYSNWVDDAGKIDPKYKVTKLSAESFSAEEKETNFGKRCRNCERDYQYDINICNECGTDDFLENTCYLCGIDFSLDKCRDCGRYCCTEKGHNWEVSTFTPYHGGDCQCPDCLYRAATETGRVCEPCYRKNWEPYEDEEEEVAESFGAEHPSVANQTKKEYNIMLNKLTELIGEKKLDILLYKDEEESEDELSETEEYSIMWDKLGDLIGNKALDILLGRTRPSYDWYDLDAESFSAESKVYQIPCHWSVSMTIPVEAESLDEACEKAYTEIEKHDMSKAEYLEDSFEPDYWFARDLNEEDEE